MPSCESADPPAVVVHDVPLAELDGLHAASTDCPCGPDVVKVNPRSAIAYHQRRNQEGTD